MLEALLALLTPPPASTPPNSLILSGHDEAALNRRNMALQALQAGVEGSQEIAMQAGDTGAVKVLISAILASSPDPSRSGKEPCPTMWLDPPDVATAADVLLYVVQGAATGPTLCLCKPDIITHLVSTISSGRTAHLSAQPGGAAAVRTLVPIVSKILQLPFALHPMSGSESAPSSQPATPGPASGELRTYQEALLAAMAVTTLVKGLEALDPEALALPISLLSRLVLGSPTFARQFMDAGGLAPRTASLLLAPTNPPSVLIDALLAVSQLARIAREHYVAISRANIYSALRALLGHWDPGVRARACNLVGNMCRHGADFYPALLQQGLLQVLIDRCCDVDRTTRKFACFAIGNAGFHNDSLYEPLRVAVAPLVALISDEEEKTRANAAGALGNLVRNSSLLCRELVTAGALESLMKTISTPESSSTSSSGEGQSPLKIALFSLGNMCTHRECRERLLQLGFRDMITGLSTSKDDTVQKYVARIQSKLQAAGA
mmetsp:Transcript_35208/g.48864  ORF Transcript_35208/g.48864 Transcript_35208/m.48864 type:complete len:493 (+) Transcript_35208:442-1920(+)